MSFKDRKRDDHGHVIGNDEVDGQECKHVNGGGKPGFEGDKTAKMNKSQYIDYLENEKGWDHEEAKHHAELFGNDAFDDDYEEEFNETEDVRAEKIANDIGEYFSESQLNTVKKYCDRFDVDFDRAKIELAKRFDKMQKDAGYNGVDAADAALEVLTDDIVTGDLDGNNEMANAELENAIKSADDDVLDEQFGKDTPERKLAGAMKQSYKAQFEPEDFGGARFYPTKSNMDGSRWVGRYRSMKDAHGLKDWNDERVKHVGDHNGTSMYQLPDGYYSINPNITSMSFKTKEALQDYIDEKNPEEHKYGVYFDGDMQRTYKGKGENGKEYDMEGPDAYKAARKAQEAQQAEENLSKELMTSLKMPGDEVERFLKDLPEDKKKILVDWLLNTKRM